MELSEEQLEIIEALIGIRSYAVKLAKEDINGNQEQLRQMRKESENMASYFCVEGHVSGCDESIRKKYLEPFEKILEGKVPENTTEMNETGAATVYKGVTIYKEELETEGHKEVYGEDISWCEQMQEKMIQISGDLQEPGIEMQLG